MDSSMSDALPVLGILAGFLILFMALLIPQIFYLLTLRKTLNKIQAKNRAMEPDMVWLYLIPIFNLGWHFYIVAKIKESLSNEYRDRGLPGDGDFGYKLGLAMCILALCGIIPFIGGLAGLAWLVVWIIYWIKIVDFSKKLDTPIAEINTEKITQAPDLPPMPDAQQPGDLSQTTDVSPEEPPQT